jgi:hypothetical protein
MHDDFSLSVRERSPVVDFENKSRRRTLVFERVAGAAQRQIVYGVLWRLTTREGAVFARMIAIAAMR